MREKTIESVITKKLNDWIYSINDESLKKLIRRDVVVSGGCFASLIANEKPKDYDIYFKTKKTVLEIAKYYSKQFNKKTGQVSSVITTDDGRVKIFIKSEGVAGQVSNLTPMELGDDPLEHLPQELAENKYSPIFLSSNAITLSDKIQLVIRFYGEPKKIHETYDFIHTKSYFTTEEGVVIPKDAYEAVINKTLIYTGSKYPVCSVVRMRKFIKRGWHINAGQILKMSMQISDLDLHDINVLEDQLVGVDSLYFNQLIDQFRAQKEKDKNWTFDSIYLNSILDKIFN